MILHSGTRGWLPGLKSLLAKQPREVEAPSTQFVSIASSEWFVILEGTVTFFARRSGSQESGWQQLVTVEQGSVIAGGLAGGELEFAIRGSLGSHVASIDGTGFEPEEKAALLEAWSWSCSDSLRRGLSSRPLRRKTAEGIGTKTLIPGPPCVLEEVAGHLWQLPGTCELKNGILAFSAGSRTSVIPGGIGVAVAEPSDATLVSCDALTDEGRLKMVLENFAAIMVRGAEDRLAEEELAFSSRLETMLQVERTEFDHMRSRLSGVVTYGQSPAALTAADVLLRVARRVMQAEGIDQPEKIRIDASLATFGQRISAIADQAACFHRMVNLEEGWHKRNAGSLLGILIDEKKPVALVRRLGRGYVALVPDSMDGFQEHKVDAAFAKRMAPSAAAFLPSLPFRKVGAGDLWRIARHGMASEFIWIIGLGLVAAILNLAVPFATGWIIDDAIPGQDVSSLVVLTAALMIAALSSASFYLVSEFALIRFQSMASVRLTGALVARAARLSTDFYTRYSSGDLLQRIIGIEYIRKTLSQTASSTLITGLFALVYLFAIAYYSAWFLLVSLIFLVVMLIGYAVLAVLSIKFYRTTFEQSGVADGINVRVLEGIETVRVNGAEGNFIRRYVECFSQGQRAQYSITVLSNIYQTVEAGMFLICSAVFYVVFTMWMNSSLSTGAFLGFMSAFGSLLGGVMTLGRAFLPLMSLGPVYDRLQPFLDEIPEGGLGLMDPGPLQGRIEITNLVYSPSTGDTPIFDGLNMLVESSSFTALVGPSGCGKSTLVKLLLRLAEPTSGTITIDSQALASLDPRALRRHIGVVLQGQTVQPASIRKNLLLDGQISDEDAWAALDAAAFSGDVHDMLMGLETIVSPMSLSGGQMQRLVIASALAAKPGLMLLDDATSALDNISQREVFEALGKRDLTLLVISQRLSTIQHADVIHYVDEGRILESGTFDELLAKKGRFAAFAERQLLAETPAGAMGLHGADS